jgi:uncharacterized iron-regulated membrane protein
VETPVDRLLNPARYAVSGTATLPPQAYVDAARRILPTDDHIASLTFPEGKGPVVVSASVAGARRQAGPPARVSVWLDPPTARVLAQADSRTGALRVIHRLHGSLLVPGVGRKIVGWIGVAMMLSCFTGLWLWWPTVGKWARGLRWRRHRNLDTNLHHLAGFWIALPLFVLSLTGAWISFPGVFAGGRSEGPRRPRVASIPIAEPGTTLDAVLAAARRAGMADLRSITWPTAGDRPAWTVAAAKRALSIDDRSGAITLAPMRPHGGPGLAGVMRRIHDGEGMGPLWQAIVFLGGVLPALLAITGGIMWWRARSWRKARNQRTRQARGRYPA